MSQLLGYFLLGDPRFPTVSTLERNLVGIMYSNQQQLCIAMDGYTVGGTAYHHPHTTLLYSFQDGCRIRWVAQEVILTQWPYKGSPLRLHSRGMKGMLLAFSCTATHPRHTSAAAIDSAHHWQQGQRLEVEEAVQGRVVRVDQIQWRLRGRIAHPHHRRERRLWRNMFHLNTKSHRTHTHQGNQARVYP